jgi:hypothetical protein
MNFLLFEQQIAYAKSLFGSGLSGLGPNSADIDNFLSIELNSNAKHLK